MITRPLLASEVAAYDQAHAECIAVLNAVIEVHSELVADEGREISTVGLAYYLEHEIDGTACARLLAIAVDRLAHIPTQ